MAQLRGSFFPNLLSSLERHSLLDVVEPRLAMTTRQILRNHEPSAWYDEGHVVTLYEAVAQHAPPREGLDPLATVREVGRDAARFAMQNTWRELMAALVGLLGGTPRMAFEQMPVLWNATRRDAGDLVCIESSSKHATTQITGFPYAGSDAWVAAWLGHHDALLRHLRFGGEVRLDSVDGPGGVVRVRVAWGARLVPKSTTG